MKRQTIQRTSRKGEPLILCDTAVHTAEKGEPLLTMNGAPHTCRESTLCICYLLADEPAEECPVHGCGQWPPRCSECGKFMPYETRRLRATA